MKNEKEVRNLSNPDEFMGYANRLAKQMNMFSWKDLEALKNEEPKIVEDIIKEYNELKNNVVTCIHAIHDPGTVTRFSTVWNGLSIQEHKIQWLANR